MPLKKLSDSLSACFGTVIQFPEVHRLKTAFPNWKTEPAAEPGIYLRQANQSPEANPTTVNGKGEEKVRGKGGYLTDEIGKFVEGNMLKHFATDDQRELIGGNMAPEILNGRYDIRFESWVHVSRSDGDAHGSKECRNKSISRADFQKGRRAKLPDMANLLTKGPELAGREVSVREIDITGKIFFALATFVHGGSWRVIVEGAGGRRGDKGSLCRRVGVVKVGDSCVERGAEKDSGECSHQS